MGDDVRTVATILAVTGSDQEAMTELIRDWLAEPGAELPWVLVATGVDDDTALRYRDLLPVDGRRAPLAVLVRHEPSLATVLPEALGLVAADWVVVVAANASPVPGWFTPLRRSLCSAPDAVGVVQPLVLQPDGTVAAAGAACDAAGRSVPQRTGWAIGELLPNGDLLAPGPRSPVVAARRQDLVRLHPWAAPGDGGLGEAALAAGLAGLGRPATLVSVGSRVLGRSQRSLGYPGSRTLSDARWLASAGERSAEVRPLEARGGIPSTLSLRWSIGTCVPDGLKGHRWGDTAFAEGLAAALRGRGHVASVDTRSARTRPTQVGTDVALALRGLHRQQPVDGALNALWVISHPDDVTEEEARGFDLVYAASTTWAAEKSEQWGREVRPLLQCTDPSTFRALAGADRGHALTFVGTAVNGRTRPLVDRALIAGLAVDLVGRGWEGAGAGATLLAEYAPTPDVAALYARSQVVLCDHWADMAAAGFVANRVFDALAAGAAVVCDDVPGVRDIAPGLVVVAGDGDDVVRAVEVAASVPDDVRTRVAAEVAAAHGFGSRAETLVSDVVRALAQVRGTRQAEESVLP